jgi:hypothetical protein
MQNFYSLSEVNCGGSSQAEDLPGAANILAPALDEG